MTGNGCCIVIRSEMAVVEGSPLTFCYQIVGSLTVPICRVSQLPSLPIHYSPARIHIAQVHFIYVVPKSREILMFVCLRKDVKHNVMPQSSIVLITLVIDWHEYTQAL